MLIEPRGKPMLVPMHCAVMPCRLAPRLPRNTMMQRQRGVIFANSTGFGYPKSGGFGGKVLEVNQEIHALLAWQSAAPGCHCRRALDNSRNGHPEVATGSTLTSTPCLASDRFNAQNFGKAITIVNDEQNSQRRLDERPQSLAEFSSL